jgi:hypothetical protein
VKLVRLTREPGGDGDVVVTVGPLGDAEADDYASRLRRLVGDGPSGLAVDTTAVRSASGETAEPPVSPADLLRTVLSRENNGGDLPWPDPRS